MKEIIAEDNYPEEKNRWFNKGWYLPMMKKERLDIIIEESIKYIKHLSEITKKEGDKIKEDINRRIGLDYVMNDFKTKLYWESMRIPPSILDSLARYF